MDRFATEVVATKVVLVQTAAQLPSGVWVLEVSCADYEAFVELPKVVAFNGLRYGLTGWNSDSGMAYYRSDARYAEVL